MRARKEMLSRTKLIKQMKRKRRIVKKTKKRTVKKRKKMKSQRFLPEKRKAKPK